MLKNPEKDDDFSALVIPEDNFLFILKVSQNLILHSGLC